MKAQQSILVGIRAFKELLKSFSVDERLRHLAKQPSILELTHMVVVFEVEVLCHQQNWQAIDLALHLHDEVRLLPVRFIEPTLTNSRFSVRNCLWTH
jgi:hypothetical protein